MSQNDLTSEAHCLLECVFSERPAPVSAVENWLSDFEERLLQTLSDELCVLAEFEPDIRKSERMRVTSEVLEERLRESEQVRLKAKFDA